MNAPFAPPKFKTDSDERRYYAAMSELASSRGYLNLSQAYALAAKDCPAGCGCSGCGQTRREVAEVRHRREAHANRRATA